ncbi:hypothetical protein ONZ45_g7764 [Pleurotus djamor]|nr:hypothetical protein ONZ45_g7764 [Pleurotus djamor]
MSELPPLEGVFWLFSVKCAETEDVEKPLRSKWKGSTESLPMTLSSDTSTLVDVEDTKTPQKDVFIAPTCPKKRAPTPSKPTAPLRLNTRRPADGGCDSTLLWLPTSVDQSDSENIKRTYLSVDGEPLKQNHSPSDALRQLDEWSPLDPTVPIETWYEELCKTRPPWLMPSLRVIKAEKVIEPVKQSCEELLQALKSWSQMRSRCSDGYVQLADSIIDVVEGFDSLGIDQSELFSIPEELRQVLETCLAKDTIPEDVELYLPAIRQITSRITGLQHPLLIQPRQTPFRSNRYHRPPVGFRETPDEEPDSASRDKLRAAANTARRLSEKLISCLQRWAKSRMEISKQFVVLADHFNNAVAASNCRENYLRDLVSVPIHLREVLKLCLAEDAIPENIKIRLDTVEKATKNLMKGLDRVYYGGRV